MQKIIKSITGIIIMLLFGIVSSIFSGYMIHVVHHYLHIHLFVFFPMLSGVVVGFCLMLANYRMKCRNYFIMAVIGLFFGTVCYFVSYYADYHSDRKKMDAISFGAAVYLSELETMNLGNTKRADDMRSIIGSEIRKDASEWKNFKNYLKIRSIIGTRVVNLNPLILREERVEKGGLWWARFIIEVLALSCISAFFSIASATGKFCDRCHEWTETKSLYSGYAVNPEVAKTLTLNDDILGLKYMIEYPNLDESVKEKIRAYFKEKQAIKDDHLFELYKKGLASKEDILRKTGPIDNLEEDIIHQIVPHRVGINIAYCPKCNSTGYLSIKGEKSMLVRDKPLSEQQIKVLV